MLLKTCEFGSNLFKILDFDFFLKKISRVGVIFMGYSTVQEILQDAVRFFESCIAKKGRFKVREIPILTFFDPA